LDDPDDGNDVQGKEAGYRSSARSSDSPGVLRRRIKPRHAWILLSVLLSVVLASTLYLLLRTRIEQVEVKTAQWEHLVHVARWCVQPKEGFSEHRPGDAFDVREDGTRFHHNDRVFDHVEHYTDREPCGQTCVPVACHTTPVRCTPNKNGTASCSGGDRVCPPDRCTTKHCNVPKQRNVYRDEPRYHSWYRWRIWEWAANRTLRRSGWSTETDWPSDEEVGLNLGLGEGEKERSVRIGKYKVTLTESDETPHGYEPQSEEEFRRFALGSKHRAKVSMVTFDLIP
jgi:hypothetical protein